MAEKRQINPAERKILAAEIKKLEKTLIAPLNWKAIIILAIITILSAIHIYYYDDSNWSLPSKFLVCFGPIGIWVTIEMKYKGKKKENKTLDELKKMNKNGLINIIPVSAMRVIEFEQKDDEGTLFLIENDKGESIYLYDDQWMIPHPRKFPCDKFDIYIDKEFAYAMSRKVYCAGKKIEPVRVPGKLSWKYFEGIERAWPGDLSKETKTFDEILTDIKTTELQSLI